MAWSYINEAGLAIQELEERANVMKRLRGLNSLVGLKQYDEAAYDKIRQLGQKALDSVRLLWKKLSVADSGVIKKYGKTFKAIEYDLKKALANAGLTIEGEKVVEQRA